MYTKLMANVSASDELWQVAEEHMLFCFHKRHCEKCMPSGLNEDMYGPMFFILKNLSCVCNGPSPIDLTKQSFEEKKL